MHQLPIPPDAERADTAIEIARGWIVDNRLQVSLLPSVWKDPPETWGVLLADRLTHVAQALAKETDLSEDQARNIISKSLIDELGMPTTKHTGEFVDPDT